VELEVEGVEGAIEHCGELGGARHLRGQGDARAGEGGAHGAEVHGQVSEVEGGALAQVEGDVSVGLEVSPVQVGGEVLDEESVVDQGAAVGEV